MKVRITCDHCSGELELPGVPAGQEIRCPLCGELLISTIAAAPPAAPRRAVKTKSRLGDSTPWAPTPDDDDGEGVPWYFWLGVAAPAAMLWFVAFEPIACAIAGGLVFLAIVVALRGSWPRWSRVMGIASLTLLAFGAAVAANLYAQGNFANFKFGALLASIGGPTLEYDNVPWTEFASQDDNFAADFPGKPTRTESQTIDALTKQPIEIATYETKYPRQKLSFVVHVLKLPIARVDEAGEVEALRMLDDTVKWLYFQGNLDGPVKRIFLFDYPGGEYRFVVPDYQNEKTPRRSAIACRAFLVRDRAYVVAATSPADKADVKPIVDKFVASFRVLAKVPAFNTVPPSDSDGKRLKRAPILSAAPIASYRGHLKEPVTLLAFSKDGAWLYSGSLREHLVRWNLESGLGEALREGEDSVDAFAPHPNGDTLVYRVRGLRGCEFLELKQPSPSLAATNTDLIAFPADDDGVAIYANGDQVEGVKYLEAKKSPWTILSIRLPSFWDWLDAPETLITSIAATNDGRLVAAVSRRDGTITMRDVNGPPGDVVVWTAHDVVKSEGAPIQQLAFTPDGSKLASAGLDQTLKIWNLADVKKPKLIATLPHDDPVACLDVSSDGKLLATGDFAGNVRIWDAATNKLEHEFRATAGKQQVQLLRFSPDGARLAVGVQMGTNRAGVNLFELKSLPRVEPGATPTPPTVAPPRVNPSPSTGNEPPLSNEPKKK